MKKLLTILMCLNLILSPVAVATEKAQDTGAQYREGSASSTGAGGYMNQILGIANSAVGSTIIMKCKMATMQPSLLVYMAGSLAYIAKEIMGGKGQGNMHKASAKALKMLEEKMKQGGDMQKATLKKALEDEKKNLEHLQGRITWMKAITAIYAIATVLAIVEWILQFPPPPAGIGIGKTDIAACSPEPASTSMILKGVTLAYSIGSSVGGGASLGQATATVLAVQLLKFIFKLEIGAKISDAMVTMLNSALGRAAYFAAVTAVSAAVTGFLGKNAKTLEGNIQKLEKVLAQFEQETHNNDQIIEGNNTNELANNNSSSNNQLNGNNRNNIATQRGEVTPLPVGQGVNRHCFTQTDNGPQYSEAACSNPMKVSLPKITNTPFNKNTQELDAGLVSSTSFAQAIADGDMGKANLEAGNLGSMAGRMMEIRDDMMKRVNDDLKARGQKPFDLTAEAEKINVKMAEDIEREFNANEGNIPGLANLEKDNSSLSKDEGSAKDSLAATEVPVIDSAVPVLNLPVVTEVATSSDAASISETTNNGTSSLSDALVKYESNESDISKKDDVSIFQQLSHRYQLSYPKIMQRRELKTVPGP